ncbi:hypothetical protein [Mycolicibacterium vaccae]|uniref:hypothetical protein n=1 Tax=Mycolicibacterium vaccae TaxID=1810 RepID=UPI00030F7376|nr:hypothetical protein [Mycolicibacterium vaccae]
MARDAAGNWIGYGPGDISPEVIRIEHRMLAAFPTHSKAETLGLGCEAHRVPPPIAF